MGTYTQQAGGTRFVKLDVPIRAFWSQTRAWHQDDVVLYVETAYLPDDTAFSIAIFEEPKYGGDEPLAVIDDQKLVNNRAAVPYKIAWDKAARGKVLALHGDRCQFFFEVHIAAPAVVGRSNQIYVHLHPYCVSG
jgi:hypothetical protein